jgi:hypothetical protein
MMESTLTELHKHLLRTQWLNKKNGNGMHNSWHELTIHELQLLLKPSLLDLAIGRLMNLCSHISKKTFVVTLGLGS